MASYEADVTPLSGKVVDGDLRKIAKVTLTRYRTPTSKPEKAGHTTVRAWTQRGLNLAAREAARDLFRRDQARRRDEISRTIERIESSRVSLIKAGE